jgi:hypothetical protein
MHQSNSVADPSNRARFFEAKDLLEFAAAMCGLRSGIHHKSLSHHLSAVTAGEVCISNWTQD